MSDDTLVNPPGALPPGTLLGELELRRVIGAGGFSIVYLAFDRALEREIAIKEYLPTSLAGRADDGTGVEVRSQADAETFALGLEHFVNEARLLASFDHPSLLKVYRFWQANGTAYMAMPVYRGRNLKQLRRQQTTPPDEAWLRGILLPLLGAIETLHRSRVYHRDIAPDNILVQEQDGRPVLLDFGAARRVIGDKAQQFTAILKPSYAPIEQYGEGGSVKQGPWTDLYALGATLHFMLLGQPPVAATARALHDDQRPLAGQALPGCSEAFLQAVDWMLAPRPADRPQDVRQLLARLGGELPGGPGAFDSWGPGTAAAPPLPPEAFDRAPPALPSAAPASQPGWLGWFGWLGDLLFPGSAKAPAGFPSASPAPQPGASPPGGPPSTPPAAPPPADAGTAAPDADGVTVIMAGPPPPIGGADHTVLLGGTPSRSDGPPAADAAIMVLRCDIASFVGRRYAIGDGGLRIGRAAPSDLDLPDPLWSRQHAQIGRDAGGFSITDLGSANGTFVNGMRIAPQRPYPLHPGASVRIGNTELTLSIEADDALADLVGAEVAGRYRLQDCVQASPKGALYRAEKLGSGVRVAIKLLSPVYAHYPNYRQRFDNEAKVAASLQHPHICRLDDHGEAEIRAHGRTLRVPFVSYPIMGGGNLADRSARLDGVDNAAVAAWITQLAQGLQHAHDHGVVHGNLKPSAICFDEAGNAYVTDFAIADAAKADWVLLGTPAFMAPEQWEGATPGPASDQFALAVLAYFMLTGARPFEGQEDPQTRRRNLGQPPAPLHAEAASRQRRKVNAVCTEVVNRALARDAAQRYPTIAGFAAALAHALRAGDRLRPGAQVFFSYRRETSAGWVTFLADQLRRDHEISSFVDTQGLDGASKFPARIRAAIENCGVFVCVLGPNTLESGYVRQEIAIAHENGRPMIPVFQEGFHAGEAELADAATAELLQYDGVRLLDRQNVYVHSAVSELAQQVRATLGMPAMLDGGGRPGGRGARL